MQKCHTPFPIFLSKFKLERVYVYVCVPFPLPLMSLTLTHSHSTIVNTKITPTMVTLYSPS